jgi:hypothetical protein
MVASWWLMAARCTDGAYVSCMNSRSVHACIGPPLKVDVG